MTLVDPGVLTEQRGFPTFPGVVSHRTPLSILSFIRESISFSVLNFKIGTGLRPLPSKVYELDLSG